ncbi:hypothetical protein N8I77_012651 [Diaporthe amygdali]|uniref:NAD(P)-binding domain-containing protein n=1 Tax=Phomopsis amygdali TaxID=1214568 RepID=A0AAD9VZ31_PHOAM|nr:hypothetical protein N8I77_012651 [Diaporthe amygdali]
MASQYAKDKPVGFTNRIEKVALVGAGGTLGKHIAQELVKTGKHVVTALTRSGSNNKLPEGVSPVIVDYDDETSLVEAMKGHQILIITLAVRAPPGTQSKLIKAASKAGVSYIMPNAWGTNPLDEKLMKDTFFYQGFVDACKEIESLGVSKWFVLSCGFWYEFSLGGTADRYGFDFHKRSLVLFDDGNTKINTSTWAQCGRAVASFLSLKLLPEDKSDNSPAIENWANRAFYASSFLVSQKDMFESVKRVTGTTDADWTISNENSEERYKKGVQDLQKGDVKGFVRLMYTRVFFPNGGGDYESSQGLQNDILGLPKEDLDEATKVAIKMALDGWLEATYGAVGSRSG